MSSRSISSARSTPPKAAIPHLIAGGQGGSIVFTSSTAGLRGFGGLQGGGLGYAASKHGIVGLMRTLANALAPQSIRVNTVHPTAVNTMMAVNPAMLSFLENYPDGGPHLQNPMPVALLEPEDISDAIAYLVSDDRQVRHRRHLPRRRRLLQQAMSTTISDAAESPASGY